MDSTDVYGCAEEELTDLEGEEGDNTSTPSVHGPVLGEVEGLTWRSGAEDGRLAPPDSTQPPGVCFKVGLRCLTIHIA